MAHALQAQETSTPHVILLTAGPGYGKTAWAEAHLREGGVVVEAARSDAGTVGGLIEAAPPTIVVEDLHTLDDPARAELLRALAAVSSVAALVVSSRVPLDRKHRGLLAGPVLERGPADLALTPAAVASVLAEQYDVTDPDAPSVVHDLTAGWPMLVHLVADTLARTCDRRAWMTPEQLRSMLCDVCGPGTTTGGWLEHTVLADLDEDLAALLASLASLDVLTPALVQECWESGHDRSWLAEGYDYLVQVGLLVRHPRSEVLARPGEHVVPLLAAVLAGHGPSNDARLRRCAQWYERHDYPAAGVRAYLACGRDDEAYRLLRVAGDRMVSQGDAADIVTMLSAKHTGDSLDSGERLLLVEALRLAGRADEAQGLLMPLVEASAPGRSDVRLACGLAALHDTRSEFVLGLAALDDADPGEVAQSGLAVRWKALRATMLSHLGRSEEAVDAAAEALALAQRSGEAQQLVWAYQASAKTASGQRKTAHLEAASRHARAAGDAMGLALILCNQGFALLADARYPEAASVGRLAVRTAELVRPVGTLAAALHNLSEALCRTGEYDEARWHLRRATELGHRLGGGRAASSLSGLGDLYRARGQREQGRRAYEAAIAMARESGERQVLVPSLAGLARIAAPDDPDESTALADEAVELATPELASYALIAQTWARLAAQDRDGARQSADRAAEAARKDQALDLLADALEARAAAEPDPIHARSALLEARSIWHDAGAGPDRARVEVLLARLEDADRKTRERGRAAAEQLRRLGVTRIAGAGGLVGEDPAAKDVRIAVLGGFEVTVRRRRVAMQAWRSRQARTLVKLLSARRGRPVSRDELCEELWPDDDPVKTPHRLSVLLATVRSVLDPGKVWPTDHYVAADARGVWLDLRRVSVDADDLIADAEEGTSLFAAGRLAEAREVLGAVDARYRGHAFEDEPYEAWTTDLREEARTAWLRSVRHLATIARREGRDSDAAALLDRLLRVDPFDERVHSGLVRTLVRMGRHGEARRAFERWAAAMGEVDAPAPDPQVLVPQPGRRRPRL